MTMTPEHDGRAVDVAGLVRLARADEPHHPPGGDAGDERARGEERGRDRVRERRRAACCW